MGKRKFARSVALMLVSLLVVSTMFVFAGCSKKPGTADTNVADTGSQDTGTKDQDTDTKKVVGFDLLFRRDEWWKDLEKTAVKVSKDLNLELRMQDADLDSEKQSQQVETFISEKVDAILMAPVDFDAPIAVINEAAKEGIPVFTIDSGVSDTTNVTSGVTHNHYQGGYELGLWAAEFINENYGGKGKVGIITDPTLVSIVVARCDGFKDGLKEKCPGAEIVAEQDGKCDRNISMSVAESILTAHPDTVVWFGGNPDMGYGAIAALEGKGIDASKVAVYTEGWGIETLQAMMKDNPYLKGVMVTPSDKLVTLALETIRKHLDGEEVNKETMMDSDMVDRSNAVEYFKAYGVELK